VKVFEEWRFYGSGLKKNGEAAGICWLRRHQLGIVVDILEGPIGFIFRCWFCKISSVIDGGSKCHSGKLTG
jgi:hypothetical protein